MARIKVLSLFDGMSCGRIALERAGIEVDKYYASEIEKNAIKVTMNNYPDTVQLGDVCNSKGWQLDNIDLLIGGSPCQSLSITQSKTRKGLDGKSKLFYEFVDIKEAFRPKWWLFENVASMDKESESVINELLGCESICIDSALVSAQRRERKYWTNIPLKNMPIDRHILLRDIVEDPNKVPDKYWCNKPFTYNGDDKNVQCTLHINGHDILKRVYNLNGKCGTLTMVSGGSQQKKVYQNERCRKLTPKEYERLQTVPDDYTKGVSDTARYSMLGNGWTVDVIVHILKGIKEII